MTHKEFFEKVIVLSDNKEMVDFANAELSKIAVKNAKAKEARIAKSAEDEPIKQAIVDYLDTHSKALASELASVCGVSTSKVVAVCAKMVTADTITVAKVKIPKVGERNAYSIAR